MSTLMPCFLDIEASSLRMDSYPIEVAWSDPLGNIECHLLNLYAVNEWTDWDYNAQQIHGISRKQCREEGIHPEVLCQFMSKFIRPGEITYADGGAFDANWVDILYEQGSELDYAQFRVTHTDEIMLSLLHSVDLDIKKLWKLYEELKLEARMSVDGRHRAVVDVSFINCAVEIMFTRRWSLRESKRVCALLEDV